MSKPAQTQETDTTPPVNLDPVGLQIRKAREKIAIEPEQLTQLLKISVDKIKAIEQDHYTGQHIDIYFRGYIRLLCRHLQLDASAIFLELNERGFSTAIQGPQRQTPLQMPIQQPMQLKPRSIFVGIAFIAISLVSYNALQSKSSGFDSQSKINFLSPLTHQETFSLQDLPPVISQSKSTDKPIMKGNTGS